MFRSTWYTGGLGVLIGALALAPASPPPGEDFERLFRKLDADGDGRLGRYEGADALLLLIDDADEKGNGGIDAAELRRFLIEDERERNEELGAFFEELDENTDGRLQPGEIPPEFHEEALEADTDGDRQLSYEEYLALESHGFLPEEEEASFEVVGESATLNGVIGASTPGRVLELILEHPDVHTIVLEDVPGSMDDVANLRAARMVHAHGYATHVAARGVVASGGVDFFLAGSSRSLGEGARLGVHSWGGMGESALELPRDDPEHRLYLDFYEDIGFPPEFYWYTLEAADAQDIHWMTREEIELFDVIWPAPDESEEQAGEGAR